ncbi:MAG: lytic murein transglycosylase [Pseudomonadota bacterium]|nr:lytic murein transglycosylase [Pseudomonadota bacterium]
MRSTTGWLVTGLASLAFSPTGAQVSNGNVAAPSASLAAAPAAQPTAVPPRPFTPVPVSAGQVSAASGFEAFKPYLVQRARSAGVSEAIIQAYVPTLRLSERAMQLDRAQKPVPSASNSAPAPLSPYLLQHVTPSLISRGQARYYRQWPNLLRAYNLYGVDPAVVMAIYGKETSYGAVTGNFDLLDALSSLAYEGRRRELFATEFVSALKLIDSGVPRDRLKGSYAGATGYPQFMPSVVLNRRADGDGDGQADIWSNEADALASISNYLREAGWKAGVPWGTAARVPVMLDRAAIRPTEEARRCPAVFRRHSRELPVAKWRELGVTMIGRPLHDAEMARLIEPDGPGATAYLLTNNYRAILEYNCSNAYALSVALLADAIARR